ncbi:MAG: hypothetical protein ACT4PK_09780 [Gammaproteobacteria bacterium]
MNPVMKWTLLAAGVAAGAGAQEAGAGACDRTTEVAGFACQNEAKDDYWIAVGRCTNVVNNGARSRCLADAKAQLAEDQENCGDQATARAQLCAALGQAPYDPAIAAKNFLTPAQAAARPNPYLPLVPGSTSVYRSAGEVITVTVTGETREILGVEVTVVRDIVTDEDGELIEDTEDWFAQDVDGNVWYFGEIAQNFEDGLLTDVEGSWTAGVEFARPGIVMPAAPKAGLVYRQEFDLGNAEDAARVKTTRGDARTPAADCQSRCVVTVDFTPLAPGHVEHKYYAPGIGLILEVDPESGERTELVSRR